MNRISKDQYYLNIALAVSKRSTCNRRQYGAIIVKNDEIIATGYNGSARGAVNCCDAGECYRERMKVPHGQQYEKCVAVHAEQNAIISAARKDMIGATMYLIGTEHGEIIKGEPCSICQRMIDNAGIKEVITAEKTDSLKVVTERAKKAEKELAKTHDIILALNAELTKDETNCHNQLMNALKNSKGGHQ